MTDHLQCPICGSTEEMILWPDSKRVSCYQCAYTVSVDQFRFLSRAVAHERALEAVTARLYEGATLRAEVASAWVYVELGGREWHGATLGEALEGVINGD